MPLPPDIREYHAAQQPADKRICNALAKLIDAHLQGAERKIWHRHPVWFLNGNPIVGYHKLKDCVRLLFWSGQSFDEPGLAPEGSFKAAEARYTSAKEIVAEDLERWLAKAIAIQWDYKNIAKRKGKLEMLAAASAKPAGDWRAAMIDHVRTLIQQADPEAVEEIKWRKPSNPGGVPVWSHGGILCTGETYKAVVKLTFAKGASLPDPYKLFNSSLEGKARRAIDIREGESLDEAAFVDLIRAAVALNQSDLPKKRR